MGIRSRVIQRALFWASPGEWKPSPSHMPMYFKGAGAEQAPTEAEAAWSLNNRTTGMVIGGQVKDWCGIFACYVWREMGLSRPRWTLLGGKILHATLHSGTSGIQPGDIALIAAHNHHFLIIDVDASANRVATVEGNTAGQKIRKRSRPLRTASQDTGIYCYYRLPA